MVHDYSRRYSSVIGCRQRIAGRREIRETESLFQSKLLGSFMVFVVMVGVGASFWVNWRIESGLLELSRQTDRNMVLSERNSRLVAQRDFLLTSESVEKKASDLGLFRPEKGQILRLR